MALIRPFRLLGDMVFLEFDLPPHNQQQHAMPLKYQDENGTAFARGPHTDVFGKMDDELPPIRISGDVRIEVRRLAAEAHMTESEFVRNLVHVRCFGLDHVVSMQTERLRRATGNAEPMQSKAAS